MGLGLAAGFLLLMFAMIDKFEYFEASFLKAKLRKRIEEADTSINNFNKTIKPFLKYTTLAMAEKRQWHADKNTYDSLIEIYREMEMFDIDIEVVILKQHLDELRYKICDTVNDIKNITGQDFKSILNCGSQFDILDISKISNSDFETKAINEKIKDIEETYIKYKLPFEGMKFHDFEASYRAKLNSL